MSNTSVSRLKERAPKITSSIPSNKTLTPVSEKPAFGSGRKSVGKENPNTRSSSRVSGPAQKPAIRPMPRMSSDGEPRSRPRGRSPSPSDLTRVLSDMRKTRVCSGTRVLGQKVGSGFRGSSDGKENGSNVGSKFRDLSGGCKKESNLPVKFNVNDGKYGQNLDGCIEKCVKDGNFSGTKRENVNQNAILKDDHAVNIERSGSELSSKGAGVKSVKSSEEGMSSGRSNKQASKLHEKLAYLEGKVKRIASDIKKTKEMLDMNNTDASKMILSDIQEKISGIEKAMGNVIVDSSDCVNVGCSSDLGYSESAEIDGNDTRMTEANEVKQADPAKVSVKGLSCEELEARLFPHHKLLRNRNSTKVSVSNSENGGNRVSQFNSGSNSENSMSANDENLIALEFLASLHKTQPEVRAADSGATIDTHEVKEAGDAETSTARQSSSFAAEKSSTEVDLQADERLDEFDEENKPAMNVEEEMEDESISQMMEIGRKTSTGGWFVSEGESVLLAHDDGSCSFYDIANQEEKAEYRPPVGMSQNVWRDCWIVRAPSAEGCAGKYVVAASAGNTMDSGFCSWDFYSKDVRAFHTEDNKPTTRVALGSLPDNIMHRRNTLSGIMCSENRQWWYRPCGPLMVSTASCQRGVKVFDIRDGEQIMRWDVQKPVLGMEYSSPLQWRNRGKVVIAESEAISLWDVSSLNAQALLSVSTSGRRISALHINNTDGELGGGVRQRVSSTEAEGNDGVFCTADSINILDFRQPSGIAIKIPKIGVIVQSVSSRGDSVYLGCTSVTSSSKKQVSQVLQFSIRKQRIVNTYMLPESNAHPHHKALTQVWGNSNLVMAVCGQGLFVFDALRDDVLPSFAVDYSSPQKVREVIGPDDMYSPSFDYLSSQILLISRDRPAMWRYLS